MTLHCKKHIILQVRSNDADSGVDIATFSDKHVSLLNSVEAENHRIIVSGLSRESVDLKTYNQTLKDIRNNFDSFLLASGEMPESYFHGDKLHLNASGTKTLLSNINKVHNINRNSLRNDHMSRLMTKLTKWHVRPV